MSERDSYTAIAVGFLIGAMIIVLVHGAVYVTEIRDLQRRVGQIEQVCK